MTEIRMLVDSPETAAFLIAIVEEGKRAETKHPHWPTDNVKRAAIVGEESGELLREANLLDEGIGSVANLTIETIQTAATCLRMYKAIKNDE